MGLNKWKYVAFKEIFSDKIRNGIYKKKEHHGKGVKIINMGELFEYDFISEQGMKRLELTKKEEKKFLVKEGDLLFARRSLVLEGSGKCSIISSLKEKTTFESSIIRVRLDKKRVNPIFYYYFFKSKFGRSLILSIAIRTAVSGIRGSDLQNLEVPFPPLCVQNKISNFLISIDTLIENNNKRIATLEEIALRCYDEWFVQFRYPNHEKNENIQTAKGVLPKGWKTRSFFDIAHFINGYAFKPKDWKNNGKPIIKIAELKLPKKYQVKNGDILFSWSADINVYEWRKGDSWLNQHIFKVVPKQGFTNYFILYSLSHKINDFRNISQGTTMKHIKRNSLKQVKLIIPPTKLINELDSILEPIHNQLTIIEKKNAVLLKIRDLLIPKLISGEIDLSELDIIE
ncbi:MAG: restriction endonuclease subunit S [Candidatus Heimdallarchaeaceae archaeon]